jgi:hypothetical protein
MSIYRTFNQEEDVVLDDLEIVTQPVWSENLNPLSQSSANVGFFTSSAQSASSGDYYVSVYQRNPVTFSETSEIQYSIAYGHRLGSGSVGDTTIVGGNTNDTPSRAIYSQYKNILLSPDDTGFTFGSTTPDDAYFISVARARYKESLDPGNWELHISGAANPLKLIDNSGQGLAPTEGRAGKVFNIVSGSGVVTASDATVYGLFYPDLGIFVLNARALDASASLATNTGSGVQAGNHFKLHRHISASSYFAARNEQEIKSNSYFVRVKSREYNYSNNPTYTTGSVGKLRFTDMLTDPKTYITTVGLYNTNNELVAVAKLSKPLLKTFSREALIKVKLSY